MINIQERRLLGGTDLVVSPIAFGCWGIASPSWGKQFRIRDIHEVLDVAWANGVNLFDTAAVYGNGVGELIFRDLPWKKDAIIATKISAIEKPSPPVRVASFYYNQQYILDQVEESLRRLGRDYIDILQLHNWFSEWEADAEDVFSVFHELKKQGKIRAVGLSLRDWANVAPDRVISSELVDVIQTPINLFQQWAIDKVVTVAQQKGIGILARSPLDHGSLATLGDKVEFLPKTDFRRQLITSDRLAQLRVRVQKIYATADISKDQLPFFAIAYCLAQPGVTSVVVGMRNTQQVRANTSPTRYQFTREQIEKGKQFEWLRDW